jgi:hypothetical protein
MQSKEHKLQRAEPRIAKGLRQGNGKAFVMKISMGFAD